MVDLDIMVYNQKGEELSIDFVDLRWGLGNELVIVIKDKNDGITGLDERKELLRKIRKKEYNKPVDLYAPVTNGHCFDW